MSDITDIKIKRRPRPKREYTDWEAMERDFVINTEHPHARVWLREVHGWDEDKINSGNTAEHILEWGKRRASFQQTITQESLDAYRQSEHERVPELLKAKMNLVQKLVSDITKTSRWDALSTKDKRTIYEIIKTELGEPTRISQTDLTVKEPPKPLLGGMSVSGNNGATQDSPAPEAS